METRMDRYAGARENKIETLRELIDSSKNIVFLGGAGVSTESGIPDFRGGKGIYNQESGNEYRPVDIVSKSFLDEHPEEFYEFYKKKLCYPDAKPNKAHKALARLERQGKLKAIITQNIDRLHQEGGSKCTIELHGSVYRNHCVNCNKKFSLDYILQAEGIPKCDRCGGLVRPDIVLYEENLDHATVDASIKALKACDLLIIGGTSLTVYPAATFVQFIKHNKVVIINKSKTYLDLRATLTIHDSIGDVLDEAIPKRRTKAQIEEAKKQAAKEKAKKERAEARKKAAAEKAAAEKTENEL